MEDEHNLTEADEIEVVSKSQLKRESQDILKLGKRLAELSADQLAQLPLDEPVLEAIALAKKIQNKRSALKRHYQFLGKLLRARDTDEIFAAVDGFDKVTQAEIQRHRQAEHWRDQIIEQGFDAIEALVAQQPNSNRQKLRQLLRNHNQAGSDAKKTQNARLLYKDIKQTLDNDSK